MRRQSIIGVIAIVAILFTLANDNSVNAAIGKVTISVNSVDLSGNAISGMFIELQNSRGVDVAKGYTPISFTANIARQYIVYANNYQNFVFDHWDDGSTNQARPILPIQSETLTAYYSTGSTTTVPGAPTGLAATAVSSSQINLSWTAPSSNGGSPISGYKIESSTNGGTTWSTIVTNTGTTSTTYSNTGLTSSTTYTYRVSAINSVGTGSPSNTASATTSGSTSGCSGTGTVICLNTNSVNAGTDIRITGSNFAPNSHMTFAYDGVHIGVGVQDIGSSSTPSTVTTDSSGSFVAIISAFASVGGTHTISAQDTSKKSATQSVTIIPHVFIYPTSGHAGSQVLIPTSQGNGYAANSAVTIKFDGITVTPSSPIKTDSKGNFGGSFTVPTTASIGQHQIVFSDASGNSFSNSFSVTAFTTPTYSVSNIVSGGLNLPDSFAFIPDNGPGKDGSGAFMVTEKNTGNVVVFTPTSTGTFVRQSVLFTTIPNVQSGDEDNGVLGIAFDPNWTTSKMVYFFLTRNATVNGQPTNTVISDIVRYHATTDTSGNIVTDKSVGEQLVLGGIPAWPDGHNGGHLKFDSSGNLYISTGDGWQFFDGQDLTTLQAKILRITPLASPVNGQLYSIPSTNPFASSTNTSIKKEIWAYGVRNPFTFDIDSKTGKLYVSDPGFNTWERIENVTAGGSNVGWPNYESPPFGNPQNLANYTPQIYWYPHQGVEPQTGPTAGLEALTSGTFYHGNTYPLPSGTYIFGDYGVGFISALLPSSVAPPQIDQASGYLKSQVTPILYGLAFESPINMQVWNGKLYFLDLSGNVNVLNYK